MNTNIQLLDPEELLHLALNATEKNKPDEAIVFLNQSLKLEPDNAQSHYLLGAVHAQIGLYDRAIKDMTKATNLAPDLDAAHFQLGLLHISSGQLDQAIQAWAPLDKLGEEHPLQLFKTGLLHLAKDEFADCINKLNKGIVHNTINESLNNDMRKILKQTQIALDSQQDGNNSGDNSDNKSNSNHILLSGYQNTEKEED